MISAAKIDMQMIEDGILKIDIYLKPQAPIIERIPVRLYRMPIIWVPDNHIEYNFETGEFDFDLLPFICSIEPFPLQL